VCGPPVRFVYLKAGPLAGSQHSSGKSCDRPFRSRFPVVVLSPRANIQLAPKFHVQPFRHTFRIFDQTLSIPFTTISTQCCPPSKIQPTFSTLFSSCFLLPTVYIPWPYYFYQKEKRRILGLFRAVNLFPL
jgi:hypothetical protein